MLEPLPGYALVRLPQKYESGLTTEKEKYAMRSEGTLVSLCIKTESGSQKEHDDQYWGAHVGLNVFFAPYEDGEPVKHNGDEYVFLPIDQLRGVKNKDAKA